MFNHGKKLYYLGLAAVLVFITALLTLSGSSGSGPPPETRGGNDVLSAADFAAGDFDGTALRDSPVSGKQVLSLQGSSPTGSYISAPRQTGEAFSAMGLHWKAQTPAGAAVTAQVRFSRDGSQWGDWIQILINDADLPEHIGQTSSAGETIGQLAFTDEARYYQYRLDLSAAPAGGSPEVAELTASHIDAKGYSRPLLASLDLGARAAALLAPEPAAAQPGVISRAQWGANEAYMNWDPEYVRPKKIIVHHTVTSNSDPDPAATVRSIYYYHAVSLGWGDIGYNFLVDAQGRIYEGRYGGNGVVGGHALSWNPGSVGVAALGNFEDAAVGTPMFNAYVEVMVWKSNVNHIDPWGSDYMNGAFAANYLGHRDVGQTACPGDNLYTRMNSFRNAAYPRYAPIPWESPEGALDWQQRIPGGARISGWTVDPSTPDPIDVHVYLDGQIAAFVTADGDRPDVGAAYPEAGSAHGFTAELSAPEGTHLACAYGINVGEGENMLINCVEIEIDGRPAGSLDGAAYDGSGGIQASGWALDPDTAAPVDVQLYVNGIQTAQAAATAERGDIAEAFPDYGPEHGFSAGGPILGDENSVCAVALDAGGNGSSLIGCRTLTGGWAAIPPSQPPSGTHYLWPWYDSVGGSNWVLMANPAAAGPDLNMDLNIGGKSLDLTVFGGPALGAGAMLSASYGGLADGPVVATELGGGEVLASQRTLWKGKSLEEVPAGESGRLSNHFYWPWYDYASPGYQNWVLLANPGTGPVYFEIKIGGEDPGAGSTGTVGPGEQISVSFPGRSGGPVEVTAWTGADAQAPAQVIASQRVLTGFGEAFNEVPGIPETELSSRYIWTWYDMESPGAADWVVVSNPGPETVYFQIAIEGMDLGAEASGTIAPGRSVTPLFRGVRGGPVRLEAWTDAVGGNSPAQVIASQRVVWGPSMEETPGFSGVYAYPLSELYSWTWYDQASAGVRNWIMVTNPGEQSIYYEITIAGQSPPGGSGTLLPGQSAMPSFPGRSGGPVQVRGYTDESRTQAATVMASQRVLWGQYFNEVTGTVNH